MKGLSPLHEFGGFAVHPENERGRVKTGILLWALGVPLPIVLLILLLTRGC